MCVLCTNLCVQGSQHDNVHLHVEKFKAKRNVLYTGATRARKKLKISGLRLDDGGVELRNKMELHPKSVLFQVSLGKTCYSEERVREAKHLVATERARWQPAHKGKGKGKAPASWPAAAP